MLGFAAGEEGDLTHLFVVPRFCRISYDPKRTVFIGDRLETDVLFAKRGEIDSILVWTGISKPKVHERPLTPLMMILSC